MDISTRFRSAVPACRPRGVRVIEVFSPKLGPGAPGSQLFSIVDSVIFAELDSGQTGSTAVPLPGTLGLFALGAAALALLAACGQSSTDRSTNAPHKLATAAISVTASQFEVTGMQKLGEARVSRTVYDYTYQVTIRNNGSSNAANVQAALAGVPNGVTAIDGQVAAGSIGTGASVSPQDTIVLRVDRSIAFDPAALTWNITSTAVKELEPVYPAEVVLLSLAELGLPDGADKVSVSGAVSDVLLKDGMLCFSTPGDTGTLQHAEFTLVKGDTSTILSLTILTDRPTEATEYFDGSEDGSEDKPKLALTVSGLGANNSFVGNTLTFKLQGAPALNLAKDSDGLVLGPNNVRLGLKPYWTFNHADNSFTISGSKLQEFMAALPPGALNLSLNFVSEDSEFGVAYDMLAIGQPMTINGRLLTLQGQPVTTLGGKKMLLRGYNQRLRQVVVVDVNGGFTFTNVIPDDVYQLTLNDLENPNVVSASFGIWPNSTTANVSVVYNLGPAPMTMTADGPSPPASFKASSIEQDGTPPPARSLVLSH